MPYGVLAVTLHHFAQLRLYVCVSVDKVILKISQIHPVACFCRADYVSEIPMHACRDRISFVCLVCCEMMELVTESLIELLQQPDKSMQAWGSSSNNHTYEISSIQFFQKTLSFGSIRFLFLMKL